MLTEEERKQGDEYIRQIAELHRKKDLLMTE